MRRTDAEPLPVTHTKKHLEYNHTKVATTDITNTEFKPWITQQHVRRVLLKFKAKNPLAQIKSNQFCLNTSQLICLKLFALSIKRA